MPVSVQIDGIARVRQLIRDVGAVNETAYRLATNASGAKARTRADSMLRAKYGMKKKDLKKPLKYYKVPPKRVQRKVSEHYKWGRLFLGLFSIFFKDKGARVPDWPGNNQFRANANGIKTFGRRPNPLNAAPRSRHSNPAPSGRANPGRHSLPIDRVGVRISKRAGEVILRRAARVATRETWHREYNRQWRRLMDKTNARRRTIRVNVGPFRFAA